jgi:uncharacterized protein YbbC (DUF1343 family)
MRRVGLAFSLVYFAFLMNSCTLKPNPTALRDESSKPVLNGLDVLLTHRTYYDSSRTGLFTNQTGVTKDLKSNYIVLSDIFNLKLIFSPEHGLYGAENAGDVIDESGDKQDDIAIISTYGLSPKRISPYLDSLDIIIFDMQDTGIRAYTYISSLAYIIQATNGKNIKLMVLDRPNPINGLTIEGNVLNDSLISFVGIFPMPYRYAMTIGELALMFRDDMAPNLNVEVIKMENWKRSMDFNETGLVWVPPSPHVPHPETIYTMIATGVFGELGTLHEGVGNPAPFEYAGGPWITNPVEYADALNQLNLPGIVFRAAFWKPYYGKYKGQTVGGVQLHIINIKTVRPYLVGLCLLHIHQTLYPEIDLFENQNRWDMFAKVTGSNDIRLSLMAGKSPLEIESQWQSDIRLFMKKRSKYLLYD